MEAARLGAPELVNETRELWAQYRTETSREIPVAAYPASIRQLQPKRVWASPQGVYVETYSFFVESAGIFVRHDPAYEPPISGDPGFEPLSSDVYWFYAPG
jgi:hypothetical protein